MPKLEIKTLQVGQLKANCYLVWDNSSKKTLIIDPGDDMDYIIRVINDLDITPIKIIATHGHFDHIGAVMELKLAYKIPFLINNKDQFLLDRMRDSSIYFTNVDPGPPPKADNNIKAGDKISLSKHEFSIIETPGHSPGSISLYCKKENIIFVGDLMFEGGGIGRYDFKYSDKEKLDKSINNILKLPKDTIVYSGHGDGFELGDW